MAINDDFGMDFSNDPFDNVITVTIDNKGDHPTRGFDIAINEKFESIQLMSCAKGTPAGKIEQWRSTI